MIKIVRIEHPDDELGFFYSGIDNNIIIRNRKHSMIDIIMERHRNARKFPNYYSDKELKGQLSEEDLQAYKFGYKSLNQLKTGFTNEELKEAIDNLGFRIYFLSVDDYFESAFQVVFRNPLQKEDISTLFI